MTLTFIKLYYIVKLPIKIVTWHFCQSPLPSAIFCDTLDNLYPPPLSVSYYLNGPFRTKIIYFSFKGWCRSPSSGSANLCCPLWTCPPSRASAESRSRTSTASRPETVEPTRYLAWPRPTPSGWENTTDLQNSWRSLIRIGMMRGECSGGREKERNGQIWSSLLSFGKWDHFGSGPKLPY